MNRPGPARKLSDLVRPALADALKAQGFAAADILQHWTDIVGERLATRTMPVRLIWPPRPKAASPDRPPEPATLVLKVESAYALEVEMAAAQIAERINGVFGWRCVGRVRLRQGSIEVQPARRPPQPAVLDATEERHLERDLSDIADEGLREALARLGREVRSRTP